MARLPAGGGSPHTRFRIGYGFINYVDVPAATDPPQVKVSTDEWFDKFDKSDLAFLYQAKKASGEDSTFFKLVNR